MTFAANIPSVLVIESASITVAINVETGILLILQNILYCIQYLLWGGGVGKVQGSTREGKGEQGSTREYKGVQGSARENKGVQGSTREYKRVQGSTREYKGVQGSTMECKGVQGSDIIIYLQKIRL